MKRLEDKARVESLIDEAISRMALDLDSLTVLTEAASGVFITTALIAARAGAKRVFAVTRDSSYGTAEEVAAYGREWAEALGLAGQIEFSTESVLPYAAQADIVTNLGFVRPISAEMVACLPSHAVICLMWEPWEFRPDDIDLAACQAHDIPVIGTRETDKRVRTFDYVGMLALKLLFEAGVEIFRSHIAVLGSDPFGTAIEQAIRNLGGEVTRLNLPAQDENLDVLYGSIIERADALVLAEHRDHRLLIGGLGGVSPHRFSMRATKLVHICGNIDCESLGDFDIHKHPAKAVKPGYMTVTTDYVGPKPVIDLHTAGLKVGEIVARHRRAGASVTEAEEAAVSSGLGARLVVEAAHVKGHQ